MSFKGGCHSNWELNYYDLIYNLIANHNIFLLKSDYPYSMGYGSDFS